MYFGDVGAKFVEHYFDLFKKDKSLVTPMYTNDVELKINDNEVVKGKDAVISAISALDFGTSTPEFIAQPGKKVNDVVVTVYFKGDKQAVITFILASVGPNNQFGITYQLVQQ